jgi:hypothetical protein
MKKICFVYLLVFIWAAVTFAAEITVILPNGGEKWVLGETKVIRWRTVDLTNNIKIVLFKDGNRLGPIVNNIDPSTGLYSWTVGTYQGGKALTGSGFKIKIKELNTPINDLSDGGFEILKTKPKPPAPPVLPDIVVTDIKKSGFDKLIVSLENKSSTPTGLFHVKVEWRRQTPLAPAMHSRIFQTGLVGYSSQDLTTDPVLERGRRYIVSAIADHEYEVIESNEKNNQLTTPLPAYSLEVKNVNIHKNNTPDTYVTLKMKNKGPLASPPYWISLGFSSGPSEPSIHRVLKSVPAQANNEERFFTFDSTELPSGEYHMRVNCMLDPNQWTAACSPVSRPNYKKLQPHLTLGLFDFKIKEVTRHRNNKPDTYIKFKVKNIGQGTSSGYKIKYSFAPWAGTAVPSHSFFSEQYSTINPNAVRQHTISDQLLVGRWKLGIMVVPQPVAGQATDTNLTNNFATQKYHKK